MRVGFFIALYHPASGGAEVQAALQAKKLSERGISVEVVTSRLPGTRAHENIDGIPVRRISYFSEKPWVCQKTVGLQSIFEKTVGLQNTKKKTMSEVRAICPSLF